MFQRYTGTLVDYPDVHGLGWALEKGLWTRTLDRFDDEHIILIEGGAPVGFVKYCPPFGGRCHLLYILVRVEGQRRGPVLLDEFLSGMKQAHSDMVVECEILSTNPLKVERILKSRGFQQVGADWECKL